MTNYAELPDGSLDEILGRPLKTTNPVSIVPTGPSSPTRCQMTKSAPHDGQRPPLSEEKSVRMHETMEHLPPRASGSAPSEAPRQDATGTDQNRTVSAPVHAPPAVVESSDARLRNALQILALKDSAQDQFVEGFKRSYAKNRQIYNHEIAARALWAFAWQCLGLDEVERLVAAAARQLTTFSPTPEQVNALPPKIRGYIHDLETNCDPAGMVRENVIAGETTRALHEQLREMERTNRELAGHNEDFRAAESVIDSLESQRG